MTRKTADKQQTAKYLNDVPLELAKAKLFDSMRDYGLLGNWDSETLLVNEDSVGRILANPVKARHSVPHYHSSAMDGYAVRSVDTENARPASPISLHHENTGCLPSFQYVDTGDPLPFAYDAVVPVEFVQQSTMDGNTAIAYQDAEKIFIRESVVPWSHVRLAGEDLIENELVLPPGHKIRPVDLGVIVASGNYRIQVARKPKIAIIPTGTEMIKPGRLPGTGEIIEFNSLVLAGKLGEWGAVTTIYPIQSDDVNQITDSVAEAARSHDLVLLLAGSSAGSEDFSSAVIGSLGEVVVHGVAIRPGHPVIIGFVNISGDSDSYRIPIIGVPGYPVSAALTADIFVRDILTRWLGTQQNAANIFQAKLTNKLVSSSGDDEYIQLVLGEVKHELIALPLKRGAGVLSSIVNADATVVVPRNIQGYEAGTVILAESSKNLTEIRKNILLVGSHDMSIDLLIEMMGAWDRRLVTVNVGSLAGIMALRRQESHIAGIHLLDTETGLYNDSYIKKYFPGKEIFKISFVRREQGIIVKKGNPASISSIGDFVDSKLKFINRQLGSGTRILLDYLLEQEDIRKDQVTGYDTVVNSHLSAALAVKTGQVDCTLGISTAAVFLDLEFLPIQTEQFDFIVRKEFFEDPLTSRFVDILRNPGLKRRINELHGYSTPDIGEIQQFI
jgi:putative molybdopterin biosynthesis protein